VKIRNAKLYRLWIVNQIAKVGEAIEQHKRVADQTAVATTFARIVKRL
jgi:hypothetical protein